MSLNYYKIIFNGKVQRVGFRNFVEKIANQFEMKGTVRNLASGEVEMVVGYSQNFNLFFKTVSQGPSSSKVHYISISLIPDQITFNGFKIT